jgi:hypothetical protein
MPERVHSSDIQLFVNDQRIPAVQSVRFSSSKELADLRALGSTHVIDRILTSNQSTQIDLQVNLATGATGIDPIYSYQQMQSGFLSTGGFEFKVKDVEGVTTITNGSLINYSINGAVGNLVKGSTSYKGNGASFTSAGSLSSSDQSNDSFGGFFRPDNIEITSTTNGKEGVNSSTLNIQDFSLSVSTPRRDVTRLGTREPLFRYPELPSQGSLNFNIIKNQVTGINISSLVCDSGVIKIDLKDDAGNSVMDFTTSGCCLESVDESTALDDNTTLSFSYYFPIIQ